jgi:pyrrolidone-carboxylate peptidase
MIILVGFESFGTSKSNISQDIVNKFDNHFISHKIQKIILPVSWKRSINKYTSTLKRVKQKPELVVFFGAYTKKNIRIEKNAWNLSFGIDEDRKFRFGFVKFSYLIRIKSILNLDQLDRKKFKYKIDISSFPGSYLCNYMYFKALKISEKNYPVIFIHLPSKSTDSQLFAESKSILAELVTNLL